MLGIGRLYDFRKFIFVSATVGGISAKDSEQIKRSEKDPLFGYNSHD